MALRIASDVGIDAILIDPEQAASTKVPLDALTMLSSTAPTSLVFRWASPRQHSSLPCSCQAPSRATRCRCGARAEIGRRPLHERDRPGLRAQRALPGRALGGVGIVTSGGARDTDEIIKQGVPLYLRRLGRGIRPGRNEVESVNRPVTIGGALVRPGDVIVADGDGVIVVPRKHAAEVARLAHVVLESDKAGRRRLYQQLGLPEDASVRPRER